MIIETLRLRDFRNYAQFEIKPHPGVNLLFGQNGSGKTNLLEAVHYCALGRSHRTAQDMEVVRKGAEAAACGQALQAWSAGGHTDAQLENLLSRHASTRERLPLSAMDALYARVFEITGRPDRVLDLACGINPLYLGARGIRTTGIDISGEAVRLVNAAGETYGMPVDAACRDLLCDGAIPEDRCDVALLFKVLPLLERQRAGAAVQVMCAIHAAHIVASFPTRTLGGRNVGMAEHYAAWMAAHTPANRTVEASFEIENELFYVLKENNSCPSS